MNYGRPSTLNPRISTFAGAGYGGSPNYIPAAQTCCSHGDDALDQLQDGLESLRAGTQDVGRLARIMQSTRLYALIDEPTLSQIKAEVSEAVEPQLEKLIAQAEKSITNLERTATSLQKKTDALQARLSAQPAGDQHAGAPLHVRNEIRKTKLLAKQEQMMQNELDTLQNEIDDLELQLMTQKSAPAARAASRARIQATRNR